MTKFEAAKLKEVAMGMEMGHRHLLLKALDTIEKLNDDLQRKTEAFDEASKYTLNMLQQARRERDVVTRRMIELEQENAALLKDLRNTLLGDPCDVCGHCHGEDDDRCVDADCDCEVCKRTDCVCRDCRDCDKWIWRGKVHGKA